MEAFRDIVCQQSNGKPLNDELSLLMLTAYNGMGTVLVQLFAVVEQLTERKSVFGKEGMEKLMMLQYQDGETPDEESDYYAPDDDEAEDEQAN